MITRADNLSITGPADNYEPPAVVDLGTLEDLTRGEFQTGTDGVVIGEGLISGLG